MRNTLEDAMTIATHFDTLVQPIVPRTTQLVSEGSRYLTPSVFVDATRRPARPGG